jgi:hypothetical protein
MQQQHIPQVVLQLDAFPLDSADFELQSLQLVHPLMWDIALHNTDSPNPPPRTLPPLTPPHTHTHTHTHLLHVQQQWRLASGQL